MNMEKVARILCIVVNLVITYYSIGLDIWQKNASYTCNTVLKLVEPFVSSNWIQPLLSIAQRHSRTGFLKAVLSGRIRLWDRLALPFGMSEPSFSFPLV